MSKVANAIQLQAMENDIDIVDSINVDSLWIIGPRAKGGKHVNTYHGNFVPQIPNNLIRRFTVEDDVVLDMFMGSGTTLFECESLGRKFIGFDINQPLLDEVKMKMGEGYTDYEVHICDICNKEIVGELVKTDLRKYGRDTVDIVFSHPPYMDIIKFTDDEADLSHISDINLFASKYAEAVASVWPFLKKGGWFVLVIGDVYRKGEVVPLGFTLMNVIKQCFKCLLKGIVVKDMVGNRAKIGQEALWRYRAMKWGTFIFKHEYVFVFRK